MAQAETVIRAETRRVGEAVMRHRPSDAVLETLDVVHDRLESPASKLLRSIQPWSSYAVLPIFALANAGVIWSSDVFGSHGRLMLAIMLGLIVGKPIGIVTGAWVAVRLRVAVKPAEYTWFQMWGAGAMAGIGFTMSLFIAGQAYPDEADFAAAKIAIFRRLTGRGRGGHADAYASEQQSKPLTAWVAPVGARHDPCISARAERRYLRQSVRWAAQ